MQFDVYENPTPNKAVPYLLDVQNDLVEVKSTRVVAPLVPLKLFPKPATVLNPVFRIGEESYVMLTQDLASVGRENLGRKIATLGHERQKIISALDFLFVGF